MPAWNAIAVCVGTWLFVWFNLFATLRIGSTGVLMLPRSRFGVRQAAVRSGAYSFIFALAVVFMIYFR